MKPASAFWALVRRLRVLDALCCRTRKDRVNKHPPASVVLTVACIRTSTPDDVLLRALRTFRPDTETTIRSQIRRWGKRRDLCLKDCTDRELRYMHKAMRNA